MKYRKKPVEVEAFQYDGDLINSEGDYYVPDWAAKAHEDDVFFYGCLVEPSEMYIKTLEGDMQVNVGDYIIRGIQGELYPCKPDIFEATYEPVNGDYKQNPQHMLG